MPRSSIMIPFVAALALADCARHTVPEVTLIPQTRIGPVEHYGEGIVSAMRNRMRFALDTSVQVIVLRVTRSDGIEPVLPLRSRDRTELSRGRHQVDIASGGSTNRIAQQDYYAACGPAFDPHIRSASTDSAARRARAMQTTYETCVRRERARRSAFQRTGPAAPYPAPSDDVGYWLLIVSDAPTPAGDLMRRLRPMEFADTSLVDVVRKLPEALVGDRTTRWAAYYVAFGKPSAY